MAQRLMFLLLLMLLPACQPESHNAEIPTLRVLSPHGSNVREEFALGFSHWHQQRYGTPVQIEWPARGGTAELLRFLESQYTREPTCGYDLIFGGGSAVFEQMRLRGWLQSAPLPKALLETIPPSFHGVTIRGGPDAQGRPDAWIAAAMSQFGIVFNRQRLKELHRPEPTQWEELAAWQGELALGDPSKSGSVCTCYELMLQQYGWDRGWGVLVELFANAQTVLEGGSGPADEVGRANVLAAPVIDFYGRLQIAKQGAAIVGFVVPKGGSSLEADPIALLLGAPHQELATHLMEFVLSPAGQKLWMLRPGTPGGPEKKALGRLSVLPELYQDPGIQRYRIDAEINPFAGPPPLQIDRQLLAQRMVFLGDLIKVTLIDPLDELRSARRKLRQAGDPVQALERLRRPFFTLKEIPELARQMGSSPRDRHQWLSQWSQAQHQRLAELGAE